MVFNIDGNLLPEVLSPSLKILKTQNKLKEVPKLSST